MELISRCAKLGFCILITTSKYLIYLLFNLFSSTKRKSELLETNASKIFTKSVFLGVQFAVHCCSWVKACHQLTHDSDG